MILILEIAAGVLLAYLLGHLLLWLALLWD